MKERILNFFVKLNEYKKIVLSIVMVLIIIIIAGICIGMINGSSKYEKKIRDFTNALSSESEMKNVFNKTFDLRAAVAWHNVYGESEKFEEEYKNINEDDNEVENFKIDLNELAKKSDEYGIRFKVSNIEKPKRDSKNKSICTVSADLSYEYDESKSDYSFSNEAQVEFVFYKNKIIDIIVKDSKESMLIFLRNFL